MDRLIYNRYTIIYKLERFNLLYSWRANLHIYILTLGAAAKRKRNIYNSYLIVKQPYNGICNALQVITYDITDKIKIIECMYYILS